MSSPTARGIRARRSSHSMLGRIAAATMIPEKSRAMTTRIFQSTSAPTTTLRATSVATAARRAVVPMQGNVARLSNAAIPMEEQVLVDQRRHGVVLVRPLGRALLLALVGAV